MQQWALRGGRVGAVAAQAISVCVCVFTLPAVLYVYMCGRHGTIPRTCHCVRLRLQECYQKDKGQILQ